MNRVENIDELLEALGIDKSESIYYHDGYMGVLSNPEVQKTLIDIYNNNPNITINIDNSDSVTIHNNSFQDKDDFMIYLDYNGQVNCHSNNMSLSPGDLAEIGLGKAYNYYNTGEIPVMDYELLNIPGCVPEQTLEYTTDYRAWLSENTDIDPLTVVVEVDYDGIGHVKVNGKEVAVSSEPIDDKKAYQEFISNPKMLEQIEEGENERLQDIKYLKRLMSDKLGVDSPNISIDLDENGCVIIRDGADSTRILAVSSGPITSKKDLYDFIDAESENIISGIKNNNDLLFSPNNFESEIAFTDSEGKEHKLQLTADEMKSYLECKNDAERLEYLNSVAITKYNIASSKGKEYYCIEYFDNNSDFAPRYLYLTEEEYNEWYKRIKHSPNSYDIERYLIDERHLSNFTVHPDSVVSVTNEHDEFHKLVIDYTDITYRDENGELVTKTLTYSPEDVEAYIIGLDHKDLAEYVGREDIYNISTVRDNTKITITYKYKDEKGVEHTEKKVFDIDNPDEFITRKMVEEKYVPFNDFQTSNHTIKFDDGRVINLTEEQYREYRLKGADYLSTIPAYMESLIAWQLNNDDDYKSSFDVRYDAASDSYIVISSGQIIARFAASEVSDENGVLDNKNLKEKINEYDDANGILQKSNYGNNPKFELSQRMISFDDEQQYKSIVERLQSTCEVINDSARNLSDIGGEVAEFSPNGNDELLSASTNLSTLATNADYLGSAVNHTVDVYRACDQDLYEVFDGGLVDDIFRQSGLLYHSYNKDGTPKVVNPQDDPKSTRVDIRNKDEYLRILHETAEKFTERNQELFDQLEKWNKEGYGVDKIAIDKIKELYPNAITYDPAIIQEIEKTGHVTDEQIAALARHSGVDEEFFYNCLRSTNPNEPSDYDKKLAFEISLANPNVLAEIDNRKKFINNEKYFAFALSDDYSNTLREIRENGDSYTQDDWRKYQKLLGDLGISLEDIQNMPPHQLAMLVTSHNYERAVNYVKNPAFAGELKFDETVEQYHPELLNPFQFLGINDGDYIDDETWFKAVSNHFIDHYENTGMHIIDPSELGTKMGSAKDYYKTIVKQSAHERKLRQEAMDEIMNYSDGKIDLVDILKRYGDSVFDGTIGNIMGLFDPSSTSALTDSTYKLNYMLELIESSQNPDKAAIDYSKGLISKNIYEKLLQMNTYEFTGEDGKRIEKGYNIADVFGDMTASFILGKIKGIGTGGKYLVKVLKALNKGGKTSRSLSADGVGDTTAGLAGFMGALGAYVASDITGKIWDKVWPEGDGKSEKLRDIIFGKDAGGSAIDAFDNTEQKADAITQYTSRIWDWFLDSVKSNTREISGGLWDDALNPTNPMIGLVLAFAGNDEEAMKYFSKNLKSITNASFGDWFKYFMTNDTGDNLFDIADAFVDIEDKLEGNV